MKKVKEWCNELISKKDNTSRDSLDILLKPFEKELKEVEIIQEQGIDIPLKINTTINIGIYSDDIGDCEPDECDFDAIDWIDIENNKKINSAIEKMRKLKEKLVKLCKKHDIPISTMFNHLHIYYDVVLTED